MSLYAIGDLHLSLGTNKPMDVFGPRWENYVEKIRLGFSGLTEEDVCVICGDISWGMSLDESLEDLRFIDALPGRKILLKGNHDFWWTSAANSTGCNLPSFSAIHLTNVAIKAGNFSGAGNTLREPEMNTGTFRHAPALSLSICE